MKFLSDIEQARVDFYKQHPEAVIRSLPSTTMAVCHRCHGEIRLNHLCLFYTRLTRLYEHQEYDTKGIRCPHCNAIGPVKKDHNFSVQYGPISHSICKITVHVLKTSKSFFGKETIIDSLKEIQILNTVEAAELPAG